MPNDRTKAWLAFHREHPNINEMSPAQIWNQGFDAGWYARLAREQSSLPQSVPLNNLTPDDAPAPTQEDDRTG